VRDVKEINAEIRGIKERAKALSGFWIGELAAAIYALEWVAGKRVEAPSKVLGGPGGGHEKIAANLTKLIEQSAKPVRRPVAVKETSKGQKKT